MRKNLIFLDFDWVFGENPNLESIQLLNFLIFKGNASLILHNHCDIDALHRLGLFTQRIAGYGSPDAYKAVLRHYVILGDYEKFPDPYHTLHLRKDRGISELEVKMALNILRFHEEVV